ncbi:MAG: patatin-like phospholipase family protein [Saprospiraceae bacterium]
MEFKKPAEFDSLIKDLKNKLGVSENEDGSYEYTKDWSISDVRDDKNRQYIDLVQKGGGVLGIALVGFTYVLEEVGIRFLRLAGTSAGAINTIMLAAIGNKEDKKSDKVLEFLNKKDIFDFVDGHKIVKILINFFLKYNEKFKLFKTIPILYLITVFGGIFYLISPYGAGSNFSIIVFYIICILVTILVLIIALAVILYRRMGQAGLGLNPGENFLIWLRDVLWTSNNEGKPRNLESNKIEERVFTTNDLIRKVKQCPPLHLVNNKDQKISDLEGDITIITTELMTQNKIELPKMKGLFKSRNQYQPFEDAAEMVRASMAIPLFFESFYARNIDKELTKDQWNEYFKIVNPTECRFVDGGVLSNFPINIYFNPTIDTPRLPTIGIDLQTNEIPPVIEGNDDKNINTSHQWNLISYVGKVFNSTRNYYDKEFIQKNEVLQKSIAKVTITDAHWLDFGMDKDKKAKLFMQGAMAAYEFLSKEKFKPKKTQIEDIKANDLKSTLRKVFKKITVTEESSPNTDTNSFNWKSYKAERSQMSKDLKSP